MKLFDNITDTEFREVAETLRNLPKIKAGANFEKKLKLKIAEYNSIRLKKREKNLNRLFKLAPATLAACIVGLILLFINGSNDMENLLFSEPDKLSAFYSADPLKIHNGEYLIKPEDITNSDVVIEKPENSPKAKTEKEYLRRAKTETSSATEFAIGTTDNTGHKKRSETPLAFSNKGENVDESLKERPKNRAGGVYRGERTVNFQGFELYRNDIDLVQLRGKMDSIRDIKSRK